jgi:beta-xylosidase
MNHHLSRAAGGARARLAARTGRRRIARIAGIAGIGLAALAAFASEALFSAPAWAQPVASSLGDFPDPFVLPDGGGYYAYGTNANERHVQLRHSTDLRTWRALPDAMPTLASWVRQPVPHVWAPEVIKLGERYLLYYTAHDRASDRQCLGVAEARAPTGPFVDKSSAPLVCQAALGGTIDASPLLEGGRLYLYFKSDGNCCNKPTHLFVQELRPDGLATVGQPTMLLTNGRPWEGKVIEAPTMVVRGGKYTLLYSANDFGDGSYAVGHASCAGPTGPCQPMGDGPFLKSRAEVYLMGPGHQGVFRADGQDYIAYHAWEMKADGTRANRRFLYIDRLDWVDGQPVVKGTTLVK